MKPAVLTIAMCFGCGALGISGTFFYLHSTDNQKDDAFAPVTLVNRASTDKHYPPAVIDAVSADDPGADADPASTASEPVAAEIEEPTEPIAEVAKFEQKICKRTKDYIYRSWRVDVVNNLESNARAYVEVEWLDADGFRVAYSNETRTLAPGVNVISDTRMFDRQESARVKSFRVTEVKGRQAHPLSIGVVRFRDKVSRRTDQYIYRSWRVDIVNNGDTPTDCYVEVEWLDSDGHRVAFSNETRTLAPGVNVVTDTRMFDRQENSRVRSFRVVELNER